jgi:hypothetical protein
MNTLPSDEQLLKLLYKSIDKLCIIEWSANEEFPFKNKKEIVHTMDGDMHYLKVRINFGETSYEFGNLYGTGNTYSKALAMLIVCIRYELEARYDDASSLLEEVKKAIPIYREDPGYREEEMEVKSLSEDDLKNKFG